MADKYSTIQQHQPLRTPAGWGKQEKALIVQLDETFDDIYRRFGRLRLEDMGKAFRKEFADAEGNIAQLEFDITGLTTRVSNAEGDITTLTVNVSGLTTRVSSAEGNITTLNVSVSGLTTRVSSAEGNITALDVRAGNIELAVADKYNKISGISIAAEGINITGSKYLNINSGCSLNIQSGGTLDVDTTNFKISSVDKKMVSGAWTFDDGGVLCAPAQGGYKFAIKGDVADMPAQTIGILFQNDPESIQNWRGQMKFVIRSSYQTSHYINMLTFESDPYGKASFYPENANVDLGKSGSKYKKLYLEQLNTDSIINNGSVHTPNKLDGFRHRYTVVFDDTDLISREISVFYDDSSGCMWLSAEPGLVVQADKVYYYDLIQRSSREIKHNIRPMENRGETLDRLRPVTFVYNEDTNEKERAGLIYEDAVEVMPEICTGDEGNKAINYVELIPMLLKEIQDLRARVKTLEGREGGN